MKLHDLIQGSPQWHAHRKTHRNASDSPAVLGVSTNKTRTQLLQEMHTGLGAEFSDYVQERVIDPGHEYEAQCRPLAEIIIGESLYPVVGSEGVWSASFDGITMAETITFEHKRLNAELRACMPQDGVPFDGDVQLPAMYCVQLEHQLMVSGAEKALFMASEWDGLTLIEERHCWYYPDLDLRAQIVAAWEQFDIDLAAYTPAAAARPPAVGKSPEVLPALRIAVTGAVTDSNLAEFKETALAAIRSVNRNLVTDQQFADADQAVKWCNDVESRLEAAKAYALSQTTSIETLFRTMDEIAAESATVRLALTKLITSRKAERKGEIVAGGIAALAKHVASLNESIGKLYMPTITADFAAAVKNKRSFDSMQNEVDTVLANAKIEANTHHQRITANLRALGEHREHAALFPDEHSLVLKAPDDLAAVISSRIAEHQAKEAKRLEEQTARIRAEEQAKAQREADARAAESLRVQREADAAAAAAAAAAEQKRIADAAAESVRLAEQHRLAESERLAAWVDDGKAMSAIHAAPATGADLFAAEPAGVIERGESPAGQVLVSASTPAVVPIRRATPSPASEAATMKLGDINAAIAPLSINAAGLEQLGFTHSATEKAAKLYRPSELPLMVAAFHRHLDAVCEPQAA